MRIQQQVFSCIYDAVPFFISLRRLDGHHFAPFAMSAVCCEDEIDSLEKELANLTEEVKQSKQQYQKLLIENLQKDIIIQQTKSKHDENKYNSFLENISKSCVEKLKLVGNLQRDDSKFVSVALNGLYKNNTDIIKQRNLSGRKSTAISPEKKSILERLFRERMNSLNCDQSRIDSLPKLIRNAIDNAKRKTLSAITISTVASNCDRVQP